MFLTSFETNVSQNVKSGCINNQKFPLQHCFVPQFSKWLQHLLLQWLVAYTYHLTIASPPKNFATPQSELTVMIQACRLTLEKTARTNRRSLDVCLHYVIIPCMLHCRPCMQRWCSGKKLKTHLFRQSYPDIIM